MTTKERLKQISPLVRVVRYSREKRLAARHSLQDARFLAGRTRRSKRVEAYLSRHTSPKLQLGTGSNVYDGWLNTDVVDYKRGNEVLYLDVRKRFPLPDNSFDAVFSEHVIEHVTYRDGVHCLRECRRVLKPGGRIRVATPSLDRVISLYAPEQTDLQRRYLQWAIDVMVAEGDAYLPGFVLNNFVRSWGHQFIYDGQTLRHALETAGFVDVEEWPVGVSGHPDLVGLEQHMKSAADFNAYETMVLEARKP